MMENTERELKHQRIPELETRLQELNQMLDVNKKEFKQHILNKYPAVLIMGCARSGTTLVSQWLASLGLFAYPSNLISRFYSNPGFGARLQNVLVDLDRQEEIIPRELRKVEFNSTLGKAKGLLQPHEFWYYWRRFFQFEEVQKISEEKLKNIDGKAFVSGLAEIEQVFDKPLMMKAMIMNWHISLLNQLFVNPLFVFVHRDPVYNSLALLKAREDFYGSRGKWYSFKPPEFTRLEKLSPEQQVTGQVLHTNNAINRGLASLDHANYLHVSYEEFCASQASFYGQLREKLSALGYSIPESPAILKSFSTTNNTYSSAEYQNISRVYQQMEQT